MRGLPLVSAFVAAILWLPSLPPRAAAAAAYTEVTPGRPLAFPRDLGSHPDFRTEWWYVTGWLATGDGEPLGFQITFFRTKPDIDPANPSAFAPRQLLIAHCAVSDPKRGRLWQDQRIRRAGLGLAEAAGLNEQFRQHAVSAGTRLRKAGLNFFVHSGNIFADLLVIVDREEAEKDGFLSLMLLAETDHQRVLNVAFDLGSAGGFGKAERSDGAGKGEIGMLQIRVSPGDSH